MSELRKHGDPPNGAEQRLGVPTGWLLGCLTAVAVASLTALVLVATVTAADALSTVALALAVLAFVSQLLFAVSQGITANQQIQQVSAINTDTQVALAEIRQSTGEALARRDQQFQQLLSAIVPSAIAESLSERPELAAGLDVDALTSHVLQNALQQYGTLSRQDPPALAARSELDRALARAPSVAARLRQLPVQRQIAAWRAMAAAVDDWKDLDDATLAKRMERILDDAGEAG